ncbi:MAG: CvpA family protein, partial [Planctomycetota bacterium]
MAFYDILMLIILVGMALWGFSKGLAWQIAMLASLVVSYFVAVNFREPVSQSISADPPWNKFFAMLLLYVGTSLVIWIAFRMVSSSIEKMKLKDFDRQIGALFGAARGALYCILITLFATTLLGAGVRNAIVSSYSGRTIAGLLDHSDAVIPEEIHTVLRPHLERFEESFNEGDRQQQSQLPSLDSGQSNIGFPGNIVGGSNNPNKQSAGTQDNRSLQDILLDRTQQAVEQEARDRWQRFTEGARDSLGGDAVNGAINGAIN